MNCPKIVFVGAGSAKFVREVVIDLFHYPELQSCELSLMDVDAVRLARSEKLVSKIIQERKLGAVVSATTDRRRALEGADYVLVTIMVGGLSAYQQDVAIPAKFGVYQTVSDTIGPGGVFRTVRTAPVLQGLADDLRAVAPRAWVLNYANPMAMNIATLSACGWEQAVGLCHSIQGMARQLAAWLGIPPDELRYTAGGINHVDFYLTLTHRGRDVTPDLLSRADRIIKENPAERARFELLEHVGYFPAEGPMHQAEYYPWFQKNEERSKHYATPAFWGYENDSTHYKNRTVEIEAQLAGANPIAWNQSMEYGAKIVHAMETNDPELFYGNVPNRGLIENLSPRGVVEVPCVADANGIVASRVGAIPPQLAAVMQPHLAVHEIAVAGALQKNRHLIRLAIQADPLTAAVCTLPRIKAMVDELFEANAAYTQGWA